MVGFYKFQAIVIFWGENLMKTVIFNLFLTALFIITIPTVYPWGATGHRVVGEIAEQHLTNEAKKFVHDLLGSEKLAHAANWADEIRSDAVISAEIGKRWGSSLSNDGIDDASKISFWHYVSIPRGQNYQQSPKSPHGDIVWAMRQMDAVLRDGKTPPVHKKQALRLLAHYIGDIHQPLHSGIAEDRGGNYCWVKFFPRDVKNITAPLAAPVPNIRNLHEVFDSELIDFSELSFSDYAIKINHPNPIVLAENNREEEKRLSLLSPKDLQQAYQQKISQWQSSGYIDWANESSVLSSLVYPKTSATPPTNDLPVFCYENKNTLIQDKNVPVISYAERDQYMRIVDYRLVQAGIRLAHAIDKIARGEKLTGSEN
jgi:hypothetical protein